MEGIGLLSYYALYNLPYEKGSDKEVGLTPWFGRVFFTDGDDTCDNIFGELCVIFPIISLNTGMVHFANIDR